LNPPRGFGGSVARWTEQATGETVIPGLSFSGESSRRAYQRDVRARICLAVRAKRVRRQESCLAPGVTCYPWISCPSPRSSGPPPRALQAKQIRSPRNLAADDGQASPHNRQLGGDRESQCPALGFQRLIDLLVELRISILAGFQREISYRLLVGDQGAHLTDGDRRSRAIGSLKRSIGRATSPGRFVSNSHRESA
jgi:hypothetical protein